MYVNLHKLLMLGHVEGQRSVGVVGRGPGHRVRDTEYKIQIFICKFFTILYIWVLKYV